MSWRMSVIPVLRSCGRSRGVWLKTMQDHAFKKTKGKWGEGGERGRKRGGREGQRGKAFGSDNSKVTGWS